MSATKPNAGPSATSAAVGGTDKQRLHGQHGTVLGTSAPCAFGLIALALAVAVSGFGNRLARYSTHPDRAARASFTKLWDKQQSVVQVVGAKLKARSNRVLALHAVSSLRQSFSAIRMVAFVPVHNDPDLIASFPSLIPFRGPPASPLA